MYHMTKCECHVPPIEKQVDPEALRGSARALLGVMGMSCPSCATRVRNSLLSYPGVLQVEIELSYGLARVDYDRARTSERALLDAVVTAGDGRHTYQAVLI
jgi:copper chaperone CopZ